MIKETPFKLLQYMGVLKLLRLSKQDELTVICLHKISNEKNMFWQPVSPELFEILLKYLKRNYRVITFAELPFVKKGRKPYAIISFDDGYKDFIQYAVPLLKKYSMPCNHNFVIECLNSNMIIWTEKLNIIFQFLNSNDIRDDIPIQGQTFKFLNNWKEFYFRVFKKLCSIGHEECLQVLDYLILRHDIRLEGQMMNWEDLKSLDSNIVEIGSHTYTHRALPNVSSSALMYYELYDSKSELEKELQRPIDVLALPNSLFNTSILEKALEIGYKHVLFLNDETSSYQNTTFINRINIVQENASAMFCRVEGVQKRIKKLFKHG